MRACDYEVAMPTSGDGDWQLVDSTEDESPWGRDPVEILMALEEEYEE